MTTLGGVILSVALVAASCQAQADIVNGGFEEGAVGRAPRGWSVPPTTTAAGFLVEVREEGAHGGKRCVLVSREINAEGEGFGNVLQGVAAEKWRGKAFRLRAWIRTEVSGPKQQAQLWIRVDRKDNKRGFFDNMANRPVKAKEWRAYEIQGKVDEDAESITLGMFLLGGGKAWLDDVIMVETVLEAPRALTERGLANVEAAVRLAGYVRHFHPSDEAAEADWSQVAAGAIRAAEGAKTAVELARQLEAAFQPIAPTVSVFPTGKKPELPAALKTPPPGGSATVVAWRHTGFGTCKVDSIYRSERVRTPLKNGKLPEGARTPSQVHTADLPGGVSCLVPLSLYADARGTLPHPREPANGKPDAELPPPAENASDRATRLAAVALAWNVLQHFYPYFDVVPGDWNAALAEALKQAALDEGPREFLVTLRRMIAALHDGHGRVSCPPALHPAFRPPFTWDLVEGKLVITHVEGGQAPAGVHAGDVVVYVDGCPALKAVDAARETISGATPQWRNWRVVDEELGARAKDAPLTLVLESSEGTQSRVVVRCTAPAFSIKEPRPEKIAELKPGILYVDIDRIGDDDFRAALPRLEKARGIVFDLRGYPHGLGRETLMHLIDGPVTSAQWHVPEVTLPDRKDVRFTQSCWNLEPQAPRLRAKVAFVTDGRAISYAESWLGIVEHYKLGEIVGGPTAGTNGDINPFDVPGGFRIIWTGMKVLKHDGSRHHGVGIQPTIPVARTIRGVAAGRDELLERAIAAVEQ